MVEHHAGVGDAVLTIAPKSAKGHYDHEYFARQAHAEKQKALADIWKFQNYVADGMKILDFGCGTGNKLELLGDGTGVEINPVAAEHARRKGLTVVPDSRELPDAAFDVVISHHCLEHVEDPLSVIKEMRRLVRDGGRVVVVAPCDRANYPFQEDDHDFHLFSYSKANLGNLMRAAGLHVEEAKELRHLWPPKWELVQRIGGWRLFHLLAFVNSHVNTRRRQVRVVGRRVDEATTHA
jgi:SAM-dependent methyltransferase